MFAESSLPAAAQALRHQLAPRASPAAGSSLLPGMSHGLELPLLAPPPGLLEEIPLLLGDPSLISWPRGAREHRGASSRGEGGIGRGWDVRESSRLEALRLV